MKVSEMHGIILSDEPQRILIQKYSVKIFGIFCFDPFFPNKDISSNYDHRIHDSFRVESMDDDAPIPFTTDYSLQVLELCRLLWGRIAMPTNIPLNNPVYFEQQKRRQMLSSWLDQCILSQPKQQVDDKRSLSSMFLRFILAMGEGKL